MGFMLLPVIVLCFFLGLGAIVNDQAKSVLPAQVITQSTQAGQAFIAYRNALIVYQEKNPGFTGSVSAASLQAMGGAFPMTYLASAGNAITAFGSNGRIATAYAVLPPGAISVASQSTEGDASLGTASGSSWTGFYSGAPATALATAVPNGAIVSVTQTGN